MQPTLLIQYVPDHLQEARNSMRNSLGPAHLNDTLLRSCAREADAHREGIYEGIG